MITLKLTCFSNLRRLTLFFRKFFEKIGLLKVYVWAYEGVRKPIYEWLKPKGVIKVKAQGFTFNVRGEDYVVSSDLLTYGVWEKEETHFLLSRLQPGMGFLDIGANLGYYTLLAGRAVGNQGHVYAFEPEIKNFELLEMNVRENRLSNISIFKKAVSAHSGAEQLFVSERNLGGHTLRKENVNLGCAGSSQVETVSLDDFWIQHDKPKIDFIKIDTQGAEGHILEGAKSLLKNISPALFLEFWPYGLRTFGVRPEDLLRNLMNLGYGVQILKGDAVVSPQSMEDLLKLAEKKTYLMLFCEKAGFSKSSL